MSHHITFEAQGTGVLYGVAKWVGRVGCSGVVVEMAMGQLCGSEPAPKSRSSTRKQPWLGKRLVADWSGPLRS